MKFWLVTRDSHNCYHNLHKSPLIWSKQPVLVFSPPLSTPFLPCCFIDRREIHWVSACFPLLALVNSGLRFDPEQTTTSKRTHSVLVLFFADWLFFRCCVSVFPTKFTFKVCSKLSPHSQQKHHSVVLRSDIVCSWVGLSRGTIPLQSKKSWGQVATLEVHQMLQSREDSGHTCM